MYTVLVVVQVLVAISLIGLVLFQQGKGADAGAAFGSGASGTVFGARGSANFLSRSTAVLAVVFFVTSLALAWMVRNAPGGDESILASEPPAQESLMLTPEESIPEPVAEDVPADIPEQQPAEAPAPLEAPE